LGELIVAKNKDVVSKGMWCSPPDKNGKCECIPFADYLKMSDAEKQHFNRQRNS